MNLRERFYNQPRQWAAILIRYGIRDAFRFMSDYRTICGMIRSRIAGVIEKNRVSDPGIAFQKYLDVDLWVFEAMRRVYTLGLHHAAPQRILDIGTGAGYFPFVCRYYGHDAEAIDIPDNDMYNQLIAALGLKRYAQYVQPFEPLKLGPEKYDLVTGFMICFNNHKTPQVWKAAEWDYFMRNLSTAHVRQGGRYFWGLNAESDAEPVSPDVLGYFSQKGARINGCEISVTASAFAEPVTKAAVREIKVAQ